MKQSGAVGQSVKLFYGAGGVAEGVDTETLASKIKADIEQTGLKVELAPTDFTQHLTNYRASKEQSVIITWSPDYADANDYAGTFARTGQAPAKRVGYSNPAVDKLVDQAAQEPDIAKRTDLYVQAQKLIIDDMPFVVLYQPVAQEVMKKTVTGYVYHPVYLVDFYNLAKTG
jgi:peptide/nickel transport system substrate-binding protein